MPILIEGDVQFFLFVSCFGAPAFAPPNCVSGQQWLCLTQYAEFGIILMLSAARLIRQHLAFLREKSTTFPVFCAFGRLYGGRKAAIEGGEKAW